MAIVLGVCTLAALGVWSNDGPRIRPTVTLQPTLPRAAGAADQLSAMRSSPLGDAVSAASAGRGTTDAAAARALSASASASVKIVAQPWARVFVNGEYFDTTPFARPVVLAPGRHRVGFRNPYFESEDRIVDLAEGQTLMLRVSLKPLEGDAP